MIDVWVKSFGKAQKALDNPLLDYAISIIAPDEDRCIHRGDHHLMVRFDDAEVERIEHRGQTYYGPTLDQIAEILKFSDTFPGDSTVLVHCTAGKSRSTAIAIGILVQHGATSSQALEQIIAVRTREGSPLVIPNRMVIRFLDQLLDQQGILIREIDDHYARLSQTVPLELILRGRHTIDD